MEMIAIYANLYVLCLALNKQLIWAPLSLKNQKADLICIGHERVFFQKEAPFWRIMLPRLLEAFSSNASALTEKNL